MAIEFTLVFFTALISIALTYVFSSLFFKEDNQYSMRCTAKYVAIAGMSLLLVFLSACSGLTSSNGDAPPTITPLALTATPQSTAISITPNTSSTDWTTYHANNLRTGYIPDTPDPRSLSKIWSTKL